ncbi:HAD family hydrolase [Kribbella sp. NPDC051620]|uniref:HAD family hydrolase n=1 Tax=Kribbella sp. NPDC051620 TaxID=3364120 RepID=UPI003788B4E7
MPPLIIFDLDGTLIDSRNVMEESFREAFIAVVGGNGEPPLDDFYDLLGDSFPNILRRLGLPQQMAPVFKAAAQRRIADIDAVPEALDACKELHRRGITLAILTGKDRERTHEILTYFSIDRIFGAVAAGSDGFTPKPAPDGVLLLCGTLGYDPSDSVVVGDSAFDIQSGRSAGARTVACTWGMGRVEELKAAEPDGFLQHPSELLPYLLEAIA